MKILVACEFSGIVRDEFARMGHDAWSCDLLPTEAPGNHIVCNVLDIIHDNWDLMIAHPPCTRLCNSGVRWLHERGLWGEMYDSVNFFMELLHANIPKICVENPIMHGWALSIIGNNYQKIQPYQFGHGETKATCLWLKGLAPLVPTRFVTGRKQKIHNLPPSKNRWKERSRTYKGIAKAMAEQWGKL